MKIKIWTKILTIFRTISPRHDFLHFSQIIPSQNSKEFTVQGRTNLEKGFYVKPKVVKPVGSCPLFCPAQTGLQAELSYFLLNWDLRRKSLSSLQYLKHSEMRNYIFYFNFKHERKFLPSSGPYPHDMTLLFFLQFWYTI